MILEETPSGNLRLLSKTQPDAAVRLTRRDVNDLAVLFELLDRWARDAQKDADAQDS